VTVLFGGAGLAAFNDTWEWDGASWALRSTSGPSPREGHSLAFDADRGVVVLFGGGEVRNSETWEWDGQTWTQQQDIGPSPRSHHALALLAANAHGLKPIHRGPKHNLHRRPARQKRNVKTGARPSKISIQNDSGLSQGPAGASAVSGACCKLAQRVPGRSPWWA